MQCPICGSEEEKNSRITLPKPLPKKFQHHLFGLICHAYSNCMSIAK